MVLNNEWANNEIKGEIKRHLETHKNEKATTPNPWDTAKKSPKREIHSKIDLPWEARKMTNKKPNLMPKVT